MIWSLSHTFVSFMCSDRFIFWPSAGFSSLLEMQSSFGALRWLCVSHPSCPTWFIVILLTHKILKIVCSFVMFEESKNLGPFYQVSVECHTLDIPSFIVSRLNKTRCSILDNTDTRFEFSVSSLLIPSLMM